MPESYFNGTQPPARAFPCALCTGKYGIGTGFAALCHYVVAQPFKHLRGSLLSAAGHVALAGAAGTGGGERHALQAQLRALAAVDGAPQSPYGQPSSRRSTPHRPLATPVGALPRAE
ncbi:hypothetical protein NDU88_003136 [Pleurodeles waltl]|uniref:Uncharacterized protein n=1 Tax=Pleurodeles waltl TaxID=8319 RepID=A0AAV7UXK8_PLEWA|nr:hypothetical protein NDU88_003136 [Pleurodeles waltl]